MKTKRCKIFLDLDTEDGSVQGTVECVIQGTKRQITSFLRSKGYHSSHYIIEELPPLVTLSRFKRIVTAITEHVRGSY
jgi:hypothetical protein